MDYFDLKVQEFSNAIVRYVNDTPLPTEVKRLAVFEICQKLQEESNKAAAAQIRERERDEIREREQNEQNVQQD